MSFSNLFHIEYWFTQPFVAYGRSLWILLIGCLLLIVGGLALRLIARYQSRDRYNQLVLKRFSNLGTTMGLLALIWLFFRQERVVFLAWRFWLLVWLLILVWWLVRILEYVVKRVPIIKQEKINRANREKYLVG